MLTTLLPLIVSALVSHLGGHLATGLVTKKKPPNKELLEWLESVTKPQK
jgi:hypothetical protein